MKQARQTEIVYLFESKNMKIDLTNKKVLYLTIKGQWFELIKARIKKHEYREMSFYWCKRLVENYPYDGIEQFKKFDVVAFVNGRRKSSPKIFVECKGIDTGTGKKEWGAVGHTVYFRIELGEIYEV